MHYHPKPREQIDTDLQYLGRLTTTIMADSITKFEDEVQKWMDDCVGITANPMTPYIRAIRCHVGQFLRQHGFLHLTQQGLKYDRL